MLLSEAIRKGKSDDPLAAAHWAMTHKAPQWGDAGGRWLHDWFPQLGLSVRVRSYYFGNTLVRFPAEFVTELETAGVLPKLNGRAPRKLSDHLSLWGALAKLHDKGQSNAEIADLLARYGL